MSAGHRAHETNQSPDMASGPATLARVRRRYGRLAPVYERSLGERLLYARARRHAVELLRLAPGAAVVDIACGTGLNFPLIEEHIGPSGALIGADLAAGMLLRASARVRRSGWSNVNLVELDVTSLTRARLEQAGGLAAGTPVDAVLCTLGMSVIPQWEAAWEAMLAIVRPGGAVAVMDGGPSSAPGTAEALLARPVVWLGCRFFAADWTREPWKLAERDLEQVETRQFSWDYVRAAAGLTPGGATADRPPHRVANSNTEAPQ